MRAIRAIQCLVAIALLGATVYAQNNRAWDDPYEEALKDFKSAKYKEAAPLLEAAVKANGKAEANKYIEGVHRIDYFPYYYLGVSYFELGQFDKAQVNFDKAKNPIARDLEPKLTEYQQKTQMAIVERATMTLAARDAPPPTVIARDPEPAPAPPQTRPAPPGPDSTRPAQTANTQGAPAQPGKPQGSAPAQSTLSTSNATIARANLPGGASNVGSSPVQPSSNKANSAVDDSRRLFEAGTVLASQGNYARAEASYVGAIDKNPNNLEARDALEKSRSFAALVNDARSLKDKKGSAGEARKKLEDARSLDSARFDRDNLKALLDPLVAATSQDPMRDALKSALLALLQGNPQASIAILEPIGKQQTSRSASAAVLHAYLGVAYATRSLSSAKPDEQSRLETTALGEFKLALASQRDFQLSPRVVSPKILAMFDQARR